MLQVLFMLLLLIHQSGLEGIYKSTNSGASFSSVFTGSDGSLLGYRCDATGANEGQGWYDLCLAVDPNDADIIYLGGVMLLLSQLMVVTAGLM